MANYTKNNVKFSNIEGNVTPINQKITNSQYVYDEEGNIINNMPVINAIDIDWNNAYSNDLGIYINDTSDLVNVIASNKKSLSDLRIPKYISDLNDGDNVLTRNSFESLKDELRGKSAFEIAKELAEETGTSFPYSNEREWVASLKGEKGNTGDSAYDIARRTALVNDGVFPYANEQEWITAITNGDNVKEYVNTEINKIKESIDESQLKAGNGISIEDNVISTTIDAWINL